jgi:pentatricopeptide repeat protein
MTDVADLLQITRDSNISEADRQDVLRSLQHLADTGNQEAKNALETGLRIPLSPLQGSLDKQTFAAVFDSCCKAGWSEQAFELWNQWQAAVPKESVFAALESPQRPLPATYVDTAVLYGYCKSRNMTVPECHVFLDKLGVGSTYDYDRIVYNTSACDREGRAIPNYRWFLLKLVWDAEHLPEYDWPSRELLHSTLDKFLPIAELTVPLFKEVAALEHELLTTFDHRNEFLAAMKNRPRVRELASCFTSRPDIKVYLPDSVYDLFWQMTKPA